MVKIKKRKTKLDFELVKRLKRIKLEKMEKEQAEIYNLKNFVGLLEFLVSFIMNKFKELLKKTDEIASQKLKKVFNFDDSHKNPLEILKLIFEKVELIFDIIEANSLEKPIIDIIGHSMGYGLLKGVNLKDLELAKNSTLEDWKQLYS